MKWISFLFAFAVLCSCTNANIVVSLGSSSGPLKSILPVVENVYPVNGGNWNDYVDYTVASNGPFAQSDTACSAPTNAYYGEPGGCIHGGEKKKVIVTGYTSCNNLSITDQLNVFEWTCLANAATGNTATFFTVGLKSDKGLRELLTTAGWNQNSVTVSYAGQVIGTSASTTWWNNLILPLPSALTVYQPLTTASAIYYQDGSIATGYGYNIGAEKISVVTLGANTMTWTSGTLNCNVDGSAVSPSIRAMICTGGQNFLWIEANIVGASLAEAGILMSRTRFSRIQQTKVRNLLPVSALIGASGLNLREYSTPTPATGNLITNFEMYSGNDGVRLTGADYNIFKNIRVAKISGGTCSNLCGLISLVPVASAGANYNRFYDLNLADANHPTFALGINLVDSSYNVFSRATVSNIVGNNSNSPISDASEGILLSGSSAINNIFSQITVSGTKDAGVILYNGPDLNIFSHVTSTNNFYNSVFMRSGVQVDNTFNSLAGLNADSPVGVSLLVSTSTNNNFYNSALSSLQSTGKTIGTESSGITKINFLTYLLRDNGDTTGCYGNESNLTGNSTCTNASVTNTIGGGWSTAFNGHATSDSVQTGLAGVGYSSGTIPYINLNSLNLFTMFDSVFRSWGKNFTIGPSSRGALISGDTSRIWDWIASPAGNLYNRSLLGNMTNPQTLNTDGGSCVGGSVVSITGVSSSSETITTWGSSKIFLKTAIEINDDSIGNDDGLCESNEYCIWAPNIGSYQGSGVVDWKSTNFCTITSGPVNNVRIFKYPTN